MIRRLADQRGQSLVEFAMVAPVLLLILLGTIQAGLYLFTQDDVQQATRAGGRLLVTLRNDPNAVQEVEAKIAGAVSSEVATGNLTYSFSPSIPTGGWAPGTAVTVTVTYPQGLSIMGVTINSGPMQATSAITVE